MNLFEEVKKVAKVRNIAEKYGCKVGREGKILCPFHAEKTPSCQIYEDSNTFHCFACGKSGSVIDLVAHFENTEPKQACQMLAKEFGIAENTPKSSKVREHVYTSENGSEIARKDIYKKADGNKFAVWYRFEEGKTVKGLGGLQVPLYHCERLKKADTVYIAEGEKDVETLEKMGFTATSSPNGAGQAWKSDFNKYLIGKICVILTDNDTAGEKAGRITAEGLTKDGIPCRIVSAKSIYPEVSAKGDISDIAEAIGIEKAKELLATAVKDSAEYVPNPEIQPSAKEENAYPVWIVEGRNGLKVSPELLAEYITQNEHFLLVQRRDKEDQMFFWYEHGVYVRVSVATVKSKIFGFIEPYGVELAKARAVEETAKLLGFRGGSHFVADETRLDSDENIINFQNGILYLDTLTLAEHSPKIWSTIQIPCNWNPVEQPAPTFQKYLSHLAGGDGDTVKSLYEAIGFVISNIKIERFKKSFMLIGQGNSGKSKFLEFMRLLIGTENFCAMPFEDLDQRFSASNLYRKRLTADDDCNYCSFSNISVFKSLTGGGPLRNEEKGKQAFDFIYNGLYMVCANRLPLFSGDKGSHVYDRILPIACGNSIPRAEQDKHLLEKLYAERETIVLTAVIHLQNAVARDYNFTESANSRALLAEYQRENDVTLQFINECCISRGSRTDRVTTKVLYEAFVNWCRQNGEKFVPKKSEFAESVCQYFGLSPRDKKNIVIISRGVRYYPLTLTEQAKKELCHYIDSIR